MPAGRFGISSEVFYNGMTNPQIYALADSDKHYGILNQIYGTPAFLINGFKAERLNQNSTLQDWRKVLDPLLAGL